MRHQWRMIEVFWSIRQQIGVTRQIPPVNVK
jgi:hypothetical protein